MSVHDRQGDKLEEEDCEGAEDGSKGEDRKEGKVLQGAGEDRGA